MIPVFDLSRQNREIGKELQSAYKSVVDSNVFILGAHVTAFEKAFADYCGIKYAVGVASGTDAITLALLSLGVGRGDEVIMPANCYPSVFGVVATGATPKLVDIDPLTHNIDPLKIEASITKKTKAILPVHLYGQPADMEAIMTIARAHNIPVVEDCAQAVGATVKVHSSDSNIAGPAAYVSQIEFRTAKRLASSLSETFDLGIPRSRHPLVYKRVGSIGDVGCFSFYPTKNLGAFGDGGMIVSNDEKIYKKLKLLRMYGEETRYNSVLVGKNSRLDELQAAILLVKLKYLDKWIEQRREIARLYKQKMTSPLPSPDRRGDSRGEVFIPYEVPYAKHTYHLFVIRSSQRDLLKTYLAEHGVGTGIHYPTPIHFQPSFAYLGYKKGDFPESEKASREVISLPMYPELKNEEVEYIAKTLLNFS